MKAVPYKGLVIATIFATTAWFAAKNFYEIGQFFSSLICNIGA